MRRIPVPSTRSLGKDVTPTRTVDPIGPMHRVAEQGRRSTILKTNAGPVSGQNGGSGDDNIKVCVRIRPPNEREERHCSTPAWSWKENTIMQLNSGQRNRAANAMYTYDHLFDPLTNTEEIYDNAVRRVILATMGGFHGSVFAYGQTSTGKTHTMQGTEEQPGVIPLAIEECFSYVSSSEDDREFLFRVSYLEIYNEQVNDLLCPASTLANVRILESKKLGVQLQGVKEEVVISPQQVYALISAGEAQRHVGSTDANKNSSRSHTIFRMVIESRSRSGRGRSVMSTLSLVDLAGSESVRLANTQGQRQIEGGFINKSLLTLGKVVSMLSEDGDKVGYVPYRDSKLTRLLQPSLGGNARITIICTVTAALMSAEETHNTLKFANRAKRIKNHAAINEVSNEKTLLKKYVEEIAELKAELARAKASAEEVANGPPSIARLSPTASSGSTVIGSPHFHAIGSTPSEGASSDVWAAAEDDNETQLQNAIAHIERLILRSRSGRSETPGSTTSRSAAGGTVTASGGSRAGEGGNSNGDNATPQRKGESMDAVADDDGSRNKPADGAAAGGGASVRRSRLPPPLIDRSSMITRRQSTNFFDTKPQPLHSAREVGSFSKAWDNTGGGKASDEHGALGEDGHNEWRRRSAAPKLAHLRRQSERWTWKPEAVASASGELIVGTPPTVDGSAESSSGSPSDRRPPPLETPGDVSGRAGTSNAVDGRTGRGSDEELDATDGVDLEFELEHVHTELRNFLQKKRARKIMAGGFPGGMDSGAVIGGGGGAQGELEELRHELHKKEIDTALSQADSNFLQRELESKEADIAECMDLLEEMERQQKVLSDENLTLRRENETFASEVTRLSAILAAREQELHELKGVSAIEETF